MSVINMSKVQLLRKPLFFLLEEILVFFIFTSFQVMNTKNVHPGLFFFVKKKRKRKPTIQYL